jgi:hypothetical protein
LYAKPADHLSFGDIFAGDWFFDAYLRRDAVPLVQFQSKAGRGWKAAAPSQDRDALFAHGQQRHAILISDDCEIETILRRGGRSRVVFAAIERLPLSQSAAEEALETRAFRRFPLPPDGAYSGGIVEFQQLFAMAVDGVRMEGQDPRLTRLDDEARLQFEMRWNAYSSRRGPLAHIDNAEKLARLLSAAGDTVRFDRLATGEEKPDDAHVTIAKAVAEALGAAWIIEGARLNEVAEAYERKDSADATRAALAEAFKELAARSQRVSALLASTSS